MRLRIAAVIIVIGASVSFLVALAFGLTPRDAAIFVGLAGAAAVGVGLAGASCLRLARGRTITVQSGIVALTSVAAVAGAMVGVSSPLFEASSETGALAATLIVSGTVGVLISLALGARVDADRRKLVEATRQVARGDVVAIETPQTEEFTDVAHRVEEMAAQRDEALARERSLDRSRRELVAWVSHDLRTPLTRLRAVIETLDDRITDDPEAIRAYYRMLDVESTRLSKLIDDLLELSRISAGALELQLESLSIAELVSDVVASTREVAERKGIDIRLDVHARPRTQISASHIERALGNLLDNAIRHTPQGGTISVAVTDSPEFVRVTVEDACGGIPSPELQRLNDSTLDADVSAPASHSGLGVIIARGLAEAHAGRVSVVNTSHGCSFTIELPRQPEVTPDSSSEANR